LIRRLSVLVRKDFAIFFADRVAIGLGFVVPLVMILVFGFVFGRGGGGLGEITLLGVNQDTGPAGRRLLRDLDSLAEIRVVQSIGSDTVKLDSATARSRVEQGKNSVALIVPSDFSTGLRSGEVRLTILRDPKDLLAGGMVSGLLQRQVFSTFPGLMPAGMTKQFSSGIEGRGFTGDLRRAIESNFNVSIPDTLSPMGMFPDEMLLGTDPDTSRSADTSAFNLDWAMSGIFKVQDEKVVGQNIVNPGIAQSVAGPAVMFMLFAVGAIAASLLREMKDGTATRLLVSGVRRGELLVSKYFYALLLGSAQLAVMMIYGHLIFGLDIFRHWFALMVMIIGTALSMSAVGLITAAVSRTEEQAAGIQIVVILGMSAIGGAMFPSFMIPGFIRSLAQITPVHWAMQGFLDIFWRDQSVRGIVAELGVLVMMALILVGASVILFRRRLAVELG
jgi:ABC-2 type transport system permease protein